MLEKEKEEDKRVAFSLSEWKLLSRLLNLERDTPKEGGLGDNPPSKTGSDKVPSEVLSPVDEGAISAIRAIHVSRFACPASFPFCVVRAILFDSWNFEVRAKRGKKKKTQRRDRWYRSSVNDVVDRENKRRVRSTFSLYYFISLKLPLSISSFLFCCLCFVFFRLFSISGFFILFNRL